MKWEFKEEKCFAVGKRNKKTGGTVRKEEAQLNIIRINKPICA